MKKINVYKAVVYLCVILFVQNNLHAQSLRKSNELLNLVGKFAEQIHISATDAKNSIISSSYTDQQTDIEYVYVQQRYQGIKVFNSIITLAIRKEALLYSSGNFIDNIESKVSNVTPDISAKNAVQLAVDNLKIKLSEDIIETENRFQTDKKIIFSPAGISRRNIETELLLVSVDDGKTVKLSWNVNIDENNSEDWWNVRIDAKTGAFIEKDNWTVHESRILNKHHINNVSSCVESSVKQGNNNCLPPPNVTSVSYNVVPFPLESPNYGSVGVDTNPWLKAGAGNNAITYGWHFDGTSNYTTTRGNNVFAFEHTDTLITTGDPATSTTSAPSLTFNFTPDFTKSPSVGGSNNQKFGITNLFYWNNLMHDVMYQYGFDEVSGNFQNNNISRGGTGADYVNALAQDGTGMDNANFSAPVDGLNGRMRMYLWSALPPTLTVTSPAAISRDYVCIESNFSIANKLADVGTITGQLVYFNDNAASTHLACSGVPANSLTGKIAVIDRGTCNFVVKVKEAQNAGAIAVIMVNNVAGNLVIMSGSDNSITIPAVMVSDVDGQTLESQIDNGVTITLTTGGQNFDGDIDNGVVCHEYGHGVSIRLTGGPANSSCLSNAEEAGEGWSDYIALMMTTNWGTSGLADGPLPRTMATYAFGQDKTGSGIRNYPYSTDMSVDPHTYADLANSGEVHDIGEVWCSALWDMTWNIIQQTGVINPNIYQSSGPGGNVIALKLVIQGLKLQKCSPGFLDSRNAILAADSILYNKAYRCAIWTAFARRGMGLSAIQGTARNTSDQTAAFDLPACTIVPLNLLNLSATLINDNKVLINWKTANEINTSRFVLQQSIDGINWVDIFSTVSKRQLSNSYQYYDYHPVFGVNYYRIKMIDEDLTYKYSQIQTVKVEKMNSNNCFVVPNPAINFTDIHFDRELQSPHLFVYDAKGRLVQEEMFSGNINSCHLLTTKLGSGVYSIKVKSSREIFAAKLIVTHQ